MILDRQDEKRDYAQQRRHTQHPFTFGSGVGWLLTLEERNDSHEKIASCLCWWRALRWALHRRANLHELSLATIDRPREFWDHESGRETQNGGLRGWEEHEAGGSSDTGGTHTHELASWRQWLQGTLLRLRGYGDEDALPVQPEGHLGNRPRHSHHQLHGFVQSRRNTQEDRLPGTGLQYGRCKRTGYPPFNKNRPPTRWWRGTSLTRRPSPLTFCEIK